MMTDREGEPIEIGTRVMLDSWIRPDVPLALVGSRATVIGITRAGKLILDADGDAYGTRRVWPAYVSVRKSRAYWPAVR
jgi:hypothetical protein